MVNVMIPYIRQESQGNELELAITGWIRHFKEDFRLYVVGDHHPCVEKFGLQVNFIGQLRTFQYQCPDQYVAHIDIERKVRTFLNERPDMELFVMTSDDTYPVRDFTLDDIRVPTWRMTNMPRIESSKNWWVLDMSKTHELLRQMAFPEYGYVLHQPRVYETRPYRAIQDYFCMLETSFVMEDLYYNIVRPLAKRLDLSQKDRRWRFIIDFGLTKPTKDDLEKLVREYDPIFLNNGVEGWSQELEDYLKEHYKLL